MRQGCVDLESFLSLLLLLLLGQPLQSAHVVKAVHEFDDEHSNIARHRHDHLAHRLGGGGFPVGDLVEFGHTIDEKGYFIAEVLPEGIQGVSAVLDGVVQERSGKRGRRHTKIGQNRSDRQRVSDVRLSRMPFLIPVQVRGHLVGTGNQPGVSLRVVSTKVSKNRL